MTVAWVVTNNIYYERYNFGTLVYPKHLERLEMSLDGLQPKLVFSESDELAPE